MFRIAVSLSGCWKSQHNEGGIMANVHI